MPIQCSTCQYENRQGNHFCTQCGAKLSGEADYLGRLRVLFGEPLGAVFVLGNRRTTIGHDVGNIIVIGDDLISNKHAMITFADQRYTIEDRNSKNGIFVDGEPVAKSQILSHGNVIKLGSTIFKFEQGEMASDPDAE